MALTWKNAKYLYLKGLTQQEIVYDMKETLSEFARAYSTFVKWHVEFTRRSPSCEDGHHRGRPATSLDEETVEKVNKLVMSDRRLSVGFMLHLVASPLAE